MRVAVTGAGGQLGRAIVPALAASDRVEQVVALDARPIDGPASAGAPVKRVELDVRDSRLVSELDGIDVLVHLAFRVLGRGADAVSVNVEGSRHAFEAAIAAGAGAIVHASSAAAYGCVPRNGTLLTEAEPLRSEPAFYYPETKVAVERMLDGLEAAHPEIRFVRMRPVATLGPGAPEPLGGRAFVSLADFDPPMQFTWIDDVAAAFAAAATRDDARGAFNIGAPGPVPASKVAALLGMRSVRLPHRALRALTRATCAFGLPGAMDPGWVDMARYPIVVDAGRAERELGWRAGCDCEGALRRQAVARRNGLR